MQIFKTHKSLILFVTLYLFFDGFVLFHVQYKDSIELFIILLMLISIFHYFQSTKVKISFKMIVILSLFIKIPLLFSSPFLSGDIYRYLWDGFVIKNGINPYLFAPNAVELSLIAINFPYHHLINHPDLMTIYLPMNELSFFLNAIIGNDIFTYKLILLFIDFLILFLLKRYFFEPSLLFFYAFHPLLLIENFLSGHFDIFFLLFTLLFLIAFKEDKNRNIYISSFLAFFTKAYSILFLFYRKKYLLIFLLLLVLAYLFSHFLRPLESSGLREYYLEFHFNNLSFNFLHQFFMAYYHQINTLIPYKLFIKLMLVFVNGGLILIFFKKKRQGLARYILFVSLAIILLSSVVYPWYLLVIIPFAWMEKDKTSIFFTYSIIVSYMILSNYFSNGVWKENNWNTFVVYLPFFIFGLINLFKVFYKQFAKYFLL